MHRYIRSRGRRIVALFALTAIAVAGVAASSAVGKTRDTITLHVSLFGDFGYHDLYKQFEASHPGITITEDRANGRTPEGVHRRRAAAFLRRRDRELDLVVARR